MPATQAKKRDPRASALIAKADQAFDALTEREVVPRSLLMHLVQTRYEKIRALRQRGDSWETIGKALRDRGVCFTAEALRRAVNRHEKQTFGKAVTTGSAKRRRRASSTQAPSV